MEGDLYPLWFLKNIIWMHLASKNRLYFLQKNCLSTKPTNIYTAQWSINLNFIQNFKIAKKMHSWYAYVTHTCLNVATKTRKLQKNASMTYARVIHVCLDVALREGNLYPLQFPKNIYQPVQLIANLLQRPSSSHMQKNTPPIIESKNAKTSLLVYWMRLRQ